MEEASPMVVAGRYQLGSVIGGGGMGEVREARDLELDRNVAIKLLRPHLDAEMDVRARFEAEGEAAQRLTHPNIVAVFDTGEDEGVPFIVMELLSGRTLAHRLAEGRLSEGEVRRIALEVLAALQASHEQGILHRDLKPGNVMLTQDGTAKVADFGIAKITEGMDITNTGLMLGTPAYLAPERIAGEPATPQTDIYSLGVVLYELLTGNKPFDADTPLGLVRAIQEDEPEPLQQARPGIDPGLAEIVEKAMAKDPRERYSSAEEMAQDLREWKPADLQDQTDALDVGSTSGIRIGRKGATKKQRRLVVLILVVVAVAWPVFVVTRLGKPPPVEESAAAQGAAPLPPALEASVSKLEAAVSEAGLSEVLQPEIDKFREAARARDGGKAEEQVNQLASHVGGLAKEGRLQGPGLDKLLGALAEVKTQLSTISPPAP